MSIPPVTGAAVVKPIGKATRDTPRMAWAMDCLILIAISWIVLWSGLGTTKLWDQDEGYYASVALEMFDRGDWLEPTFNQELFAHKPPLMFWGMIAGMKLFGVTEFAVRVPSALFGTGMVLLTYWLARMLFDRRTALLSGSVLASGLMFSIVSRSATADAHLGFFVLLAITLWVREATSNQCDDTDNTALAIGSSRNTTWPVTSIGTWCGIYASISGAVLAKGPIGFAFPIAILGLMTLLWPKLLQRERTSATESTWIDCFRPIRFFHATVSMRPVLGFILLASIASPWFVAMQWRTEGRFLSEFFGVQHFERFAKPMDNHSGPFFYYFAACLVGFFPWTSFAIPIGMYGLRQWRTSKSTFAWYLIAIWISTYMIVFSVASTKLPNYIVPAFPPIAIWIGNFVASWNLCGSADAERIASRWRLAGWSFLCGIGLLMVGLPAILSNPTFGAGIAYRYEIDPRVLPAIQSFFWMGISLLLTGIAGFAFQRFGQSDRAMVTLVLSSAGMMWVLWQVIAPEIDKFQTPQEIASQYLKSSETNGEPFVQGMFRPSMVFYARRRIEFSATDEELGTRLNLGNPRQLPDPVIIQDPSGQGKELLAQKGYLEKETWSGFPKRGSITIFTR